MATTPGFAGSGSDRSLPAEASQRLRDILERFGAAWRQDQRPRIRDYLADIDSERLALLVELVREDLEQRLRAGEAVRVEMYLEGFPELANDSGVAADLIAAEFVLREGRGEAPRLEDYLGRFPQQAEVLPQRVADRRAWAIGRAEAPTLSPGVPAPEAATLQPAAHPGSEAVAEEMPPDTGPAVAGYEVQGRLGKGGMGVVYKARQLALDRLVALKMILHAEHAGPEERQRFRSEAQAVARLQHPNIVQVHEVGECNGLPYFSLEFCPGGSLADKLDGTPWEAQAAARLIEALARAM
jgi:hypothetical protein